MLELEIERILGQLYDFRWCFLVVPVPEQHSSFEFLGHRLRLLLDQAEYVRILKKVLYRFVFWNTFIRALWQIWLYNSITSLDSE